MLTYRFDACGDTSTGDRWRFALRRYAEDCHFDPGTTVALFADADKNTKPYLPREPFPRDHIFDGGLTCGNILGSDFFPDIKARIRQFEEGKVSASTALRLNCDGSHGTSVR